MQRVLYFTFLITLVVAPLTGTNPVPVVAVESRGSSPEIQSQFQLQEVGLDTERVLLRFDIDENGTAAVVVEYRLPIDEAPETTAFVDLQQDIAANQSVYLDRFERRMTETVQTAAAATDRQMNITDVAVQAEIRQLPAPYGVVAYRFTWHGFAAVEDGDIRVGDALGGLYLEEGAQLQISWPEGYEARSVHAGVSEQRDRAAIWAGPVWFDRTGPQLDLARGGGGSSPAPVALLGLSLLFAVSGFVFWLRIRRSTDSAPPAPSSAEAPGATNPDGGRAMTAAPSRSNVDVELLSNEERIIWEIERRGGRMKQRELVAALDWSDAKVSRAVTSLRADGTLDGFRIGNENVLALPAQEDAHESEVES
jgi:hypothetical protein